MDKEKLLDWVWKAIKEPKDISGYKYDVRWALHDLAMMLRKLPKKLMAAILCQIPVTINTQKGLSPWWDWQEGVPFRYRNRDMAHQSTVTAVKYGQMKAHRLLPPALWPIEPPKLGTHIIQTAEPYLELPEWLDKRLGNMISDARPPKRIRALKITGTLSIAYQIQWENIHAAEPPYIEEWEEGYAPPVQANLATQTDTRPAAEQPPPSGSQVMPEVPEVPTRPYVQPIESPERGEPEVSETTPQVEPKREKEKEKERAEHKREKKETKGRGKTKKPKTVDLDFDTEEEQIAQNIVPELPGSQPSPTFDTPGRRVGATAKLGEPIEPREDPEIEEGEVQAPSPKRVVISSSSSEASSSSASSSPSSTSRTTTKSDAPSGMTWFDSSLTYSSDRPGGIEGVPDPQQEADEAAIIESLGPDPKFFEVQAAIQGYRQPRDRRWLAEQQQHRQLRPPTPPRVPRDSRMTASTSQINIRPPGEQQYEQWQTYRGRSASRGPYYRRARWRGSRSASSSRGSLAENGTEQQQQQWQPARGARRASQRPPQRPRWQGPTRGRAQASSSQSAPIPAPSTSSSAPTQLPYYALKPVILPSGPFPLLKKDDGEPTLSQELHSIHRNRESAVKRVAHHQQQQQQRDITLHHGRARTGLTGVQILIPGQTRETMHEPPKVDYRYRGRTEHSPPPDQRMYAAHSTMALQSEVRLPKRPHQPGPTQESPKPKRREGPHSERAHHHLRHHKKRQSKEKKKKKHRRVEKETTESD